MTALEDLRRGYESLKTQYSKQLSELASKYGLG